MTSLHHWAKVIKRKWKVSYPSSFYAMVCHVRIHISQFKFGHCTRNMQFVNNM